MTTPMRSIALAFAAILTLGGCETMGGGQPVASNPFGDGQRSDTQLISPGQSRQLLLEMVTKMQAENLHRAALAYLDEFNEKIPGDESATLLRAKSLSALGFHRDAELAYWDLIKTRHAPAAYNGLGILASREGRWNAAEQEFTRAVKMRPTNAGFLNNLGHAQLRLGLLDEANFTLSQALELKADDVTAQANLIVCLHLAGRALEAELLMATLPAAERARVQTYVGDYLRDAMPEADAKPMNIMDAKG